MMVKIIVDGKEAIFGRMASFVAKELLKGNSVEVLNCEEVIISGDKTEFVKKLLAKLNMGRGSSLKGPKYSRVEDRLLKRMIRGMLPWDRPRGKAVYKNLRCHIGNGDLTDEDLKNVVKFERRKPMKYFRVKEVVERLK